MSRGEQMKLRLLTAMAYRPELLILDEPFSGLDPLVREELSSGLLELVGEGDWTVVIADHDVDEVERLADHAGFIARGSMQFSESMDLLQSRFQRVTARFAAEPASNPRPPNWLMPETGNRELRFMDQHYDSDRCRMALEQLGPLESMEVRPATLREIFVTLTRDRREKEKREIAR